MADIQLYHGDCLDVLKSLPAGSVDAVVTDPPYLLAASSSLGKQNGWGDLSNASFWYTAWYRECWRVLKETGHFLTFGNWRSLPVILCAMSAASIHATSCLIWDKEWIGPSHQKAFRPTYEVIVHAAKSEAIIADRGCSDLFHCKWMASHSRCSNHAAEKPVALLASLVEHTTTQDATVLDPFMGSGTTGVACVQTGRKFIGIEIDESYFKIAQNRIAAEQARYPLFAEGKPC